MMGLDDDATYILWLVICALPAAMVLGLAWDFLRRPHPGDAPQEERKPVDRKNAD
jgi:hypothetical protein